MWEIKNPRLPVWSVVAVTFCLHIYWFVLWVKGISRKIRERGRKGGKGGGMAAAAAAAGGGELDEVRNEKGEKKLS